MTKDKCRISGSRLNQVIDLGDLYVSNFYEDKIKDAVKSSLSLGIGEESGLLQLMDTADQDSMYKRYWYSSGTNKTMRNQLKDIVRVINRWVHLEEKDVILDIGCNDGTLLGHFSKRDGLIKVGIDPAKNLANEANKHCDLHAISYFDADIFYELTDGRKAKAITSIAMFYGLDDPHSFVKDIANCLHDEGIWVLQMSYTPLMIAQNAFDNICHEHIEYYTLRSLEYLLKAHNLRIIDVQLNDVNSGSFCVVVAKRRNTLGIIPLFIQELGKFRYKSIYEYEVKQRYDSEAVYNDFMKRINHLRDKTRDVLKSIRNQGKTIYGYGASTKGNTLLQYYGLSVNDIIAIAERQPSKYELYTAGSWIPIVSEAEMREAKPDYLFILPWHFVNEFVHRENDFLKNGGKFIIPLPEIQII